MRERESERGRAGLWCTVIIVALLSYVLSLAPACCVSSRFGGERVVTAAYGPLTWFVDFTGSRSVERGITWYAEVGAAPGWTWLIVEPSPGARHRWWQWVDLERVKNDVQSFRAISGPP